MLWCPRKLGQSAKSNPMSDQHRAQRSLRLAGGLATNDRNQVTFGSKSEPACHSEALFAEESLFLCEWRNTREIPRQKAPRNDRSNAGLLFSANFTAN